MPRFTLPFIAAGAAALWGVAGTNLLPVDGRLLPMDRGAAQVLSILFGVGWMLSCFLREPVVRRLADAVIASRRAAVRAVTGPHRVIRPVRAR